MYPVWVAIGKLLWTVKMLRLVPLKDFPWYIFCYLDHCVTLDQPLPYVLAFLGYRWKG